MTSKNRLVQTLNFCYFKLMKSKLSVNEFNNLLSDQVKIICKTENKNFVFDAGTGIVKLGQKIIANNDKRPIDIFIGHYHYDHILGLPFFAPLFNKEIKINI